MKKSLLVLYILFACFGVHYLPYTYMYYVAHKNANDYACDENGNINIMKRSEYFTTVWDENDAPKVRGFDFSYNNIKSKALKLGLDFNGGVSILLDVDINDFIKEITYEDYKNQICDILTNIKLPREDYDLQEYIAALITLAKEKDLDLEKCFLVFDSNVGKLTGEKMKSYLCDMISHNISIVVGVITQRLRKYGIHESYIHSLCGGRKIQIELPDDINYSDVKDLLQHPGNCKFYLEYDEKSLDKIIQGLNEIIDKPSDKLKELSLVKNKQKLNTDMSYSKEAANDVEEFLNMEEIKNLCPADLKICKRIIYEESEEKDEKDNNENKDNKKENEDKKDNEDKKNNENDNNNNEDKKDNENDKNNNSDKKDNNTSGSGGNNAKGKDKNVIEKVKFYFIDLGDTGRGVLSGDYIESVNTRIGRQKDYIVDVNIKKDGIDTLKQIADNNKNKRLILTLDDDVIFVKKISEDLDNNKFSITGKKRNEAKVMVAILNNRCSKLNVNVVECNNIGITERTLTKQALVKAILFGILLIGLLMILLYRKSGFMIDISLLVVVFYLLVLLHVIPYDLTLANIISLGVILPLFISSIVTIQEKIKRVMREGNGTINYHNIRTIYRDVVLPIFDGHMIVLLICIVILFCLANVNIRGFLTIISMSVVVSFLTSYYFSHFLFWVMFRLKRLQYMSFSWSFTQDIFQNLRIDFVKLRFLTYMFSTTLFAFGIYSIYQKGIICSADLCGGYKYIVKINGQNLYNAKILQNTLRKSLHRENIVVKEYGVKDTYEITVGVIYNRHSNDDDILTQLYAILEDILLDNSVILKSQSSLSDNSSISSNSSMTSNTNSGILSDSTISTTSSNESMNTSSDIILSGKSGSDKEVVYKKYELLKKYKIESSITKKIIINVFFILLLILLIVFFYFLLRFKTWQYALTSLISSLHSCIGFFAIYGLMRYLGYDIVLDDNLIAFMFVIIVYAIKNIVNIISSINGYINVSVNPSDNIGDSADNNVNAYINRFANIELSHVLITLFSVSMFVSVMCFWGCVTIVDFWFVFLSLIFVDLYFPFFITTAILKFLF